MFAIVENIVNNKGEKFLLAFIHCTLYNRFIVRKIELKVVEMIEIKNLFYFQKVKLERAEFRYC